MRPDMRAAWLSRLSTAPCSRIVALLWPRLLPLHPLLEHPPSPQNEPVEVPQPVGSLSARVLDQKGIYLLENGTSAVVHFGPDAPAEHIMLLLGTTLGFSSKLESKLAGIGLSSVLALHWDCTESIIRWLDNVQALTAQLLMVTTTADLLQV